MPNEPARLSGNERLPASPLRDQSPVAGLAAATTAALAAMTLLQSYRDRRPLVQQGRDPRRVTEAEAEQAAAEVRDAIKLFDQALHPAAPEFIVALIGALSTAFPPIKGAELDAAMRVEVYLDVLGEFPPDLLTGKSLALAATLFDVSPYALRRFLVRHGLLRPYEPKKNGALRHANVTALLGRICDATIARAVKCSRNTVWKYRRSIGVPAHRRRKVDRVPIRIYSIDKPRFRGGSFHEVHKDAAWSDWLEEMGATAW
jgi:hypothetical protein